MSATTIRELLVRIGVDGTEKSAKGVGDLDAALTDLVTVAAQVVAGAIAIAGAIAGIAISAASAGDAVDKGAQAAAISTDAYQELAYVASQSGTDIEVLTKALGKQTQGLAQLAAGAGPAYEALTELGLTYEELNALSPDQQFAATSTAIAGVTDEQERLRLATAIYGEDMAQQLMPTLALGGAAMDDMRAQAHDLGLVMGEDAIASSVLFTESLDQLMSIVTGLKNAIGIALLPVLTDLIARVRDWYAANGQLVRQKIADWADIIVAAIESLVRWMELADDVVQRVFGGWEPILAAAAGLVAALSAAVVVLAGLKAWVAIQGVIAAVGTIGAGTFGFIVLAVLQTVAAVVWFLLVMDDLLTFFRGGDSVIGRFVDRFLAWVDTMRGADTYIGAMIRAFDVIFDIVGELMSILGQVGAIAWAVFSRIASFMGEVFSNIDFPILRALGSLLLWIGEAGFGAMAWWANTVVIPALTFLLSLLREIGSALSAVGGVLGIDVGSTAATPDGAASSAATGASFAPEALTSAAGAAAAGPSTNNVQVQGSTLNVQSVVTMDEIERLFQEMMDSQNAQTAAALAGAEV